MEIEYSRELDNRFVILPENADGEAYVWKMLETVRFPFLLVPLRRGGSRGPEVAFAVDGLTSLETMAASRPILAGEVRSLIGAIYRCCGVLEEYLLPPDSLILEPGLIFRRQEEWIFLLLPGYREELYAKLQALSRFLLRKCDHGDPEAAAQGYELFRVCHEDNVSFTQIREALKLDAAPACRLEESGEARSPQSSSREPGKERKREYGRECAGKAPQEDAGPPREKPERRSWFRSLAEKAKTVRMRLEDD